MFARLIALKVRKSWRLQFSLRFHFLCDRMRRFYVIRLSSNDTPNPAGLVARVFVVAKLDKGVEFSSVAKLEKWVRAEWRSIEKKEFIRKHLVSQALDRQFR